MLSLIEHGADALVGKQLDENGMADPAVDDMGPAHALAHRIHTAVDFTLRPPHAGHPLFPHQIIFLSSTPTGEPLRSPVGVFRKSCPEIFRKTKKEERAEE